MVLQGCHRYVIAVKVETDRRDMIYVNYMDNQWDFTQGHSYLDTLDTPVGPP